MFNIIANSFTFFLIRQTQSKIWNFSSTDNSIKQLEHILN